MDPSLRFELERAETAWTLRFHGELDMQVAPELRRIFENPLRSPPPVVIVDLEDVPFVDSSVIATFVYALKNLRKAGSNLRIVHCAPNVRDTFEITRLTDAFGIE